MKIKTVALGSCALVAVVGYFFVRFFLPIPQVFFDPAPSTTKILDANDTLLYEITGPHQGRTTARALSEISPHLVNATLAAEDARFYKNSGVDWRGTLRALINNTQEGKIVSGASTITQQLVRNVFGTRVKRTFTQKIKESLYARRLTQKFSKDKILELYLNRVYYGNLNYGIEAAAQGYFNKAATNLDLAESSFIAGLPQAPAAYNPFDHFDTAKKRQERVLNLMVRHGFISQEEATAAFEETLTLAKKSAHPIQAPHAVYAVIDELKKRYGDDAYGGFTVRTTIDYALQEKIQEDAVQHVKKLNADGAHNAAAVIMDADTGAVRVLIGSVDFFNTTIEGQVNSAFALRQPGSTIKPFTYALAFERGWTPRTLITDEPVRFFTADGSPYTPKNFDFDFHGTVSVRTALANSYNIPALKALNMVGIDTLLERLREAGITTLTESADHYGLALTLGDGEVRLIDLTAAYGAFARGGTTVLPYLISSVEKNGRVLFDATYAQPKEKRIFSKEIAFLITNILKDPHARIEEFGLKNKLELPFEAAAKTGTTRNFKDAWTIGYTRDMIVGVWVGNNDGSPMNQIAGSSGAAPLWHTAMLRAHSTHLPVRDFVVPEGVEKKDGDWIIRGATTTAMAEIQSPLKIVQPFNGDEFKLSSLVQGAAGDLRLRAQSSSAIKRIDWYVNGTFTGTGEDVWWKPRQGTHTIEARGKNTNGTTHTTDSITITIH